jgi:hypothetical protein
MKEIDSWAGTHISDVCAQLVKEAPAFLVFNGIRLEARPGDTATDLEAHYVHEMKAVHDKRERERKAFDATPEGQKRLAEGRAAAEREKKRRAAHLAEIERSGVRERFPWGKRGELSGFGGGYEAACRTMVYRGFAWLLSQGADPKTLKLDTVHREALDTVVMEAEPGCSGAMHGVAMSVCLYVAHNGWDAFCRG